MRNLPQGWLEVEIGEISDVIGGGTPTASDESNFAEPGTAIAWLTPADLSGYKGKEITHGKRDLSQKGLKGSSATLMPKGSLLFSSRAPIGYVAIAKNEIATNQGFKSFVFTSHIDPSFAYYYLISIRSLAESRGTGTTFKELSGAAAKKLPFLIAPLKEQIRIADKLDSVLAKVDAAQARLEKTPILLKRFRQSVLAAATSGELTREWCNDKKPRPIQDYSSRTAKERENKGIKESKHSKESSVDKEPFEIPNNWQWVRLGHIALKITDGAHNTPHVLDDGYPYLMAKDLTGRSLDFSENRYISEKDHRELHSKCLPEVGDLLVVNIGAGTGNNVLINVDFEFSFKNIAIIKRPSFVEAEYLKYFFDAQKKRIFDEQTRGGAQPFLSLAVLNDIPFALPSIEEQKEIVRRVESLFSLADTVEKQYFAAKQRLDRLTQSLLAKAFRGELVPQDPSDEPAAELLKRIQAERLAQPPVKNKRAKSA